MKALVSMVLAVALVGGIYVAASSGCGARAQVAGDKILELIDARLGKLDVKRKEIQNAIADLDKTIAKNRQGKVKSEVMLENFDGKIAPIQNEINRIKQALTVINPHLSASEDVEINGKMRSPSELNEMAKELLERHEKLSSQLGGLNANRAQYEKTHQAVAKAYSVSTTQMSKLKELLTSIDDKMEALDQMKQSQSILNESGSVSDSFADLEEQVEGLMFDVESELRLEIEKINEREARLDDNNSAADEILDQIESVDDTKSRIDAILGGGE